MAQPFIARSGTDAKPGQRARRARVARPLTPKPADSPYYGLSQADYVRRTRELIDAYPLKVTELAEVVQTAWGQIFESTIGGFYIGREIFPSPQAMSSLLHELIPLNLSRRYPGKWRRERSGGEKDLVYEPDEDHFSTEIKASSNPRQIFGNRSFAQETNSSSKKSKSGYYLAINFEGFPHSVEPGHSYRPRLHLIRFGWLDHVDWAGQEAPSGQQSNLAPAIEDSQLLAIYIEQ